MGKMKSKYGKLYVDDGVITLKKPKKLTPKQKLLRQWDKLEAKNFKGTSYKKEYKKINKKLRKLETNKTKSTVVYSKKSKRMFYNKGKFRVVFDKHYKNKNNLVLSFQVKDPLKNLKKFRTNNTSSKPYTLHTQLVTDSRKDELIKNWGKQKEMKKIFKKTFEQKLNNSLKILDKNLKTGETWLFSKK